MNNEKMRNTDHWSAYYLQKKRLIIVATSLLILFFIILFTRDIPSRIINGKRGRIAIKTLDNVRGPFLDIHDGTKAEIELIIIGGLLLFCCICMVFFLQWFKSRELKMVIDAKEEIIKLSQALKESPSVFMITDTKGDIEFVNPSFTQLTGYTHDEVIGLNPRFLKSGETTTEEYKRLWESITTGGRWEGVFCNKTRNGELYWESASISSMKNPDGVVTNFIKVAEDITGRMQVERELLRYRKHLEEIVENRTAVLTKINVQLNEEIIERKQVEKRILVQNAFLKLLKVAAVAANESMEINNAFLPILAQICNYTGWQIGHAYITSINDSNLLEPSTNWYIEDIKKFTKFCNVTEVTNFAKGIGLPGRVLASGRPRWIKDVRKDKGFLRAKIAKELGIKSGIAFPVMVGRRVVAVLEFFTTREVEPDQQLMEIMADVGTQLGRVVERKQAEVSIKGLAKFPNEDPNPVLRIFNDGRILYSNQASMHLLDFWGCQTTKMLPDNYLEVISDVLHSGLSQVVEVECNNCVFSLMFAPVIEEGYVNIYGLDITERKQVEKALVQSEKMKAMGIMASGVAHEFNNILAVISSNAQLLEETNRNDKELSKSLRTICRMADDGAEIVDRMYDFTNLTKDTSRYINVDLHDMIKQVIGFTMPRWKEMAQASGIKYQIVWKGVKTLPSVVGNPTELREVILNIINNALDAMPEGGAITVQTRIVQRLPARSLSKQANDSDGVGNKPGVSKKREKVSEPVIHDSGRKIDFVEIAFIDNGKGMSEESAKSIFDPFFTTRSPQGTGLGMSVSYGIIKRHGGEINVKSKPGKGTRIELRLPADDKSISRVITTRQGGKLNVKSSNILVVDDKKEICESLSKLFIEDGHKVCSVNNGDQAIKLLKKNSYDLLICDLVMPDVNGKDIVRAIKTMNKRPKVGLITGWKYKIEDAEKDGLEVDFIIKKPFNLSKLRRDINDLCVQVNK